ncbi:MAG: hypothetical protein ACREDY_02825, partial [Bradyrhizobium sp.]
ATQQDGFGLINQPGSYIWWQSNLLDMSVWPALNFASASGDPDNIVQAVQIHREIFLIKSGETEVWVNAGTPNFAFARLDGIYIEAGIAAFASLAQVGEDLMWLAQDGNGQAVVVRLHVYDPVDVSDHAVVQVWQSYPTISDAIAYAYQQGRHTFYVISFPSGNATWVYDVTESGLLGVPCWHQRGAFSNGQFGRTLSQTGLSGINSVTFSAGTIVGDYTNGNLYKVNPNGLTDNGEPRKWLRTWRATPQPTMQPQRFTSLQIDMMTGIGVPDGTAPQVVLRWSDDGGHLFSNEMFAAAGALGATAQRVKFNRLGSTRRNSGLYRIFELSSSDAFPAALIGAVLE